MFSCVVSCVEAGVRMPGDMIARRSVMQTAASMQLNWSQRPNRNKIKKSAATTTAVLQGFSLKMKHCILAKVLRLMVSLLITNFSICVSLCNKWLDKQTHPNLFFITFSWLNCCIKAISHWRPCCYTEYHHGRVALFVVLQVTVKTTGNLIFQRKQS